MIYPNKKSLLSGLIHPSQGKSALSDINKSLLQTFGVNKKSSFIIGKTIKAILSFPDTLPQSSSDIIIIFKGAKINDEISLSGPIPSPGTMYYGFINENNFVTIRFNNYSGDNVQPLTGTFFINLKPNM